jgi:hypothetical protein
MHSNPPATTNSFWLSDTLYAASAIVLIPDEQTLFIAVAGVP